jgi:hypothetical protein
MDSSYERIKYDEKDLHLFTVLIKYIKLANIETEKLLWKDFLLYFKMVFVAEIGKMYTPKIGNILRELLHIDQDLHVRKGIQLTFKEWLELYS